MLTNKLGVLLSPCFSDSYKAGAPSIAVVLRTESLCHSSGKSAQLLTGAAGTCRAVLTAVPCPWWPRPHAPHAPTLRGHSWWGLCTARPLPDGGCHLALLLCPTAASLGTSTVPSQHTRSGILINSHRKQGAPNPVSGSEQAQHHAGQALAFHLSGFSRGRYASTGKYAATAEPQAQLWQRGQGKPTDWATLIAYCQASFPRKMVGGLGMLVFLLQLFSK